MGLIHKIKNVKTSRDTATSKWKFIFLLVRYKQKCVRLFRYQNYFSYFIVKRDLVFKGTVSRDTVNFAFLNEGRYKSQQS